MKKSTVTYGDRALFVMIKVLIFASEIEHIPCGLPFRKMEWSPTFAESYGG